MTIHPDGTIDAEPCVGCGEPTLSIVEIAVSGPAAAAAGKPDGTVITERFLCRPCQGHQADSMAAWRRCFEQLLAMGCDRDTANRIVIKRMERAEAGR